MNALETGARTTSSAVAALGIRVDGGQGAVANIAGRVVALETNQTALQERVDVTTTLAAHAHKRLETLDTKLTQANADILSTKQIAVTTIKRAEAAEQASTALRVEFANVVGAVAAAGDLAKTALAKAQEVEATARGLDAAVFSLDQNKVDKTEVML